MAERQTEFSAARSLLRFVPLLSLIVPAALTLWLHFEAVKLSALTFVKPSWTDVKGPPQARQRGMFMLLANFSSRTMYSVGIAFPSPKPSCAYQVYASPPESAKELATPPEHISRFLPDNAVYISACGPDGCMKPSQATAIMVLFTYDDSTRPDWHDLEVSTSAFVGGDAVPNSITADELRNRLAAARLMRTVYVSAVITIALWLGTTWGLRWYALRQKDYAIRLAEEVTDLEDSNRELLFRIYGRERGPMTDRADLISANKEAVSRVTHPKPESSTHLG